MYCSAWTALTTGVKLAGSAAEVAGEDSPVLELSVGAFTQAAQAGLDAVGGLLRLGQHLFPAFALVAGDGVWVQADVAEIGQQAQELQHFVGNLEAAGRGDVDGPAWQDPGHPQQLAVRGCHGLYRAAVPLVLARIPVLFLGVLGRDAFGWDVDPVDDQVVPSGFHGEADHLGQRQCPPRQHLDAFLDEGAAGALRDAVAFAQFPVGVPALQPGTGQHRLFHRVVRAPAGADTPAVAGQGRCETLHHVGWRGQGNTVDDGPGSLRRVVCHRTGLSEASLVSDHPRRPLRDRYLRPIS